MSMIRSAAVAVCAAMAVSACGVASVMKASPEREADTDALLAEIGAGNADAVLGRMSSENSPAQVRAQLPFLKTLVPEGAVPPGTTGGWRANAGTAGSTYELDRAYDYPDRTLTLSVIFKKEGEAWKVLRFNLNMNLRTDAAAPAQDGTGQTAPGREGEPMIVPDAPAAGGAARPA